MSAWRAPVHSCASTSVDSRALRFFDGTGTIDHASIVDAGSESFGTNERAAVTIVTVDIQEPPESRADFGPDVTLAGTDYGIAFGFGDTYATGCQGRAFRDQCLP